jgi:uncharacterized SAM-binding protein YcdF (DUF218 family)
VRGVVIFGVLALAVLGASAAAARGVYTAVERQAARDETRAADVIIVLGSGVRPDGRPSSSLRARTLHAVELYKKGLAPLLYLTGGVGRFGPSEAAVMRRLALEAGVPESSLVLDEAATSTQESVDNAAGAARSRSWRTALLVSEPFHMLRARRMARDAGLEAYASPASDSPLHRIERLRRWYTLRETAALLWYLSLGQLERLGGGGAAA